MKSQNKMPIVWTVLATGALSAGAALLFAPQSGARTRRMVSRKAEDTGQVVREAYERVKDSGIAARKLAYRLRINLTPRLVAKRFARA
jgi:gas vesicle protein